ncbi:unnamed protein product, partial [Phaeothamnion confervicola]
MASKAVARPKEASCDADCQTKMEQLAVNVRSIAKKRKAEGGAASGPPAHAPKRFVWPESLHRDFVASVFDVGLKCSSPKLLLEMLPHAEGLTAEHVKSHLQMFRTHRQRSRGEFLKTFGTLTAQQHPRRSEGSTAAAAAAAKAAEDSVDVPAPPADPGAKRKRVRTPPPCQDTSYCGASGAAAASTAPP